MLVDVVPLARRLQKDFIGRGFSRGAAAVVLVVSHCCISATSGDHVGLSEAQRGNQKRIWTSGFQLNTQAFLFLGGGGGLSPGSPS